MNLEAQKAEPQMSAAQFYNMTVKIELISENILVIISQSHAGYSCGRL